MKVSYIQYSSNAPIRDRYQEGVDYLCHDFDFGVEETLYLIQELKSDRSRVFVTGPTSALNFHFDRESLWVEIDDVTGLWAVSEIDLELAAAILRIAAEGTGFGEHIPTTDREWDAYSGLD